MIAVIDTNVVVAGLLTRDAHSPTARILDAMLAARFRYLLSLDLLSEYRRVLLRPAIRERHALEATDVDILIERIVRNGTLRAPAPLDAEPVPGDGHLFSLLLTVPSAVLVTGDARVIQGAPDWAGVLTPKEFAAWCGV